MLNHISKLITSNQLKLPLVSLVLSISGILGVSYSSEQHQQLLSSTALAADYVVATQESQINSETSLLSRLPEIKYQSIQKSPVDASLIENITTLSTNTRELNRKGKVEFPEQDGIYLYGQSSIPNELGQGYILFQKEQNRIIGTLYVPQSEFSCFQGSLAKSGELAMTVKSSPGEVGAIEVSTTSKIPKISDDNSETYAHSISLQNYHQLSSLSANDRKMLQMCKQEVDNVR